MVIMEVQEDQRLLVFPFMEFLVANTIQALAYLQYLRFKKIQTELEESLNISLGTIKYEEESEGKHY
jgi:hypothetical protein